MLNFTAAAAGEEGKVNSRRTEPTGQFSFSCSKFQEEMVPTFIFLCC